jgi:hypothetical protein
MHDGEAGSAQTCYCSPVLNLTFFTTVPPDTMSGRITEYRTNCPMGLILVSSLQQPVDQKTLLHKHRAHLHLDTCVCKYVSIAGSFVQESTAPPDIGVRSSSPVVADTAFLAVRRRRLGL